VSWWRRPWIIPLALTTAWFLQHQIKPFAKASFQEKLSPIPPHHGFPAYYPLLMAHITFGTIAMLTVILQVWPMIRVRYPVVHRWSGRLYVISALGGGACGLDRRDRLDEPLDPHLRGRPRPGPPSQVGTAPPVHALQLRHRDEQRLGRADGQRGDHLAPPAEPVHVP
jgi:hypothetical protein